jgi:hypothetical protein
MSYIYLKTLYLYVIENYTLTIYGIVFELMKTTIKKMTKAR